jgi:hypothetical protein
MNSEPALRLGRKRLASIDKRIKHFRIAFIRYYDASGTKFSVKQGKCTAAIPLLKPNRWRDCSNPRHGRSYLVDRSC